MSKSLHALKTNVLVWLFVWASTGLAGAQAVQPTPAGSLQLYVTDQNGNPLPAAFILVEQNGKTVAQERTTPSGNAFLVRLPAGTYRVLVEKPGFYSAAVERLEIVPGQTAPVEVRLQPVREYQTEIEVMAQPSPIDPEQIASSQSLTASEISTIPYAHTRDYRNVLPYIPGVIQDTSGQIHVAGSSTQQVQDYLDGFEVSQPAFGSLGVRINPDSLRKVDVLSTRYSSMFGKGSGGLTDLAILDGDNRLRMNVTDLVPTVQNVKGIQFNNWTPRGYLSGPLVRNKLWFTLSHEGEIDRNIVKQLPDGADTNNVWRTADLARLSTNLTQGNVLTASALVNLLHSDQAGIDALNPVSVSTNQHTTLYLLTLKDQQTIAHNTLIEFGAGFQRTNTTVFPQGLAPYLLIPGGNQGNFFETTGTFSERSQGFANLYLKPWKKFGSHQFILGGRVDRVIYDGQVSRVPIHFCADTGCITNPAQILRQITFVNVPAFSLSTVESGAYVQDRWSLAERFLVEAGGRWDRDSFIGRDMFSPRLAATAVVDRASETKLSAGIGIYYDRTNLGLVSQSVQGSATDQFFSPAPVVIPSSFQVDPRLLSMPRFVNWSVGVERRLPARVYARVEFLSRHGAHGWAYDAQPGGNFLLLPSRQDRYDGVMFTVRKEWKRGYPFLVSYTRSNARSNQTIDFSLDNFIVGNQVAGPLPWDAPNQLTSWGSTPLFWKLKKFDLAYATIWHSGFPFFTVDQFGRIVSGPGQFRFPDFFTLNVAVERKFNFKGYRWAARIGINDITDRQNAITVDNNVNSPTFLTFFGQSHRTLEGRIRFLGKAVK
jgi:hypothetical protein